jgi:hypothetical protein
MAATARTGPAQTEPAPAAEEDTVKLSAAAQAETMHQAGQSISAIASSLGINTSTVDSYLGIAVAVPLSAAPAAHAAPVAKAEPVAQAAPAAVPQPVAKS